MAKQDSQNYYRIVNPGTKTVCGFKRLGFEASVINSRYAGEILFEHCESNHRIFVTLSGGAESTVAEADGAPVCRRPDRPGAVTVVPAGTRRRVLLKNGDMELFSLSLSPRFGREGAGEIGAKLLQNGRDEWLAGAGAAFRHEILSGASAIVLEGLALAIALHLEKRSQPGHGRSCGLHPSALRRTLAMMHDQLDANLSLGGLAEECGLSVSAFGRAFRHSAGTSPHAYFTQIRMRRAKELLAAGRLPVAAIASAVGYSDQAHFTAAFTRHAGRPPAKWRTQSLSADFAKDNASCA